MIWDPQGLGLDFIDGIVINLFSFHRALCLGSISLHAEYQNTNMFVLSRELGFTVSRCTLVTPPGENKIDRRCTVNLPFLGQINANLTSKTWGIILVILVSN